MFLGLFLHRQAFVQFKINRNEYPFSKGIPPHNILAQDNRSCVF